MTRDEILKIAENYGALTAGWIFSAVGLEKFWQQAYEAGVKAEREACAKLCETMSLEWGDQKEFATVELATIMDCALAIRNRGND